MPVITSPAPDLIALRELRAEGVYPFGPMPEPMARAWAYVPSSRTSSDLDRLRAVERARAAQRASWDVPRLRTFERRGLVNLTGSVAATAANEVKEVRDRELRRLRHRMRAAGQKVVRVHTKPRELALVAELDEMDPETGEVPTVYAATAVTRERWGQKLCGSANALDLPKKGEKIARGSRPERAAVVGVNLRPDGKASIGRGVYRCGSVWCCPVCSYSIAQKRGEEVTKVFEHLRTRGAAAYLLTLTARHWAGMRLAPLRRAVMDALRKLRQQRRWKQLPAELGYIGDTRALEVTLGPNGWHPHLHLLLWTEGEAPAGSIDSFRSWLAEWWADELQRATGARPDRDHGVHIERVHHRADYVTKLGIAAELTSAATKEGRRAGHRTVWELLRDLAEFGRESDAELWREWTEGIHRARQLEHTKAIRALRAELGITDRTEEELAAEEESRGVEVLTVPAPMFAALYKGLPGFTPWLLEAVERYGPRGAEELVRLLAKELIEEGGQPPPGWRGRAPATLLPNRN